MHAILKPITPKHQKHKADINTNLIMTLQSFIIIIAECLSVGYLTVALSVRFCISVTLIVAGVLYVLVGGLHFTLHMLAKPPRHF